MKKGLFLLISAALTILLNGCATTPPPAPVAEPPPAPVVAADAPEPVATLTLLDKMQDLTGEITRNGGLAALGTAESKSLDLAMNMAKKNGRLALAQILNDQVEALAKTFSEESGIPYDSLLLGGFNNAVRIITKQVIAGSIAKELKYETAGDRTTAYALMVLDPKIIADQLAGEPDLYPRLRSSAAFDALNRQIKAYEAFTAAQKTPATK